MANLEALRTKLQTRLGLGAVGTVESNRLDEAINSGILRAASDGIPGLLRDVYIAYTYEELSITVSGHDADTKTLNTSIGGGTGHDLSDLKVFPQDIIKLSAATLLLRNVLAADPSQVDFGAPYHTSLTADTGTIVRRSIELPTTGQVIAVRLVDGNKLEPHAQNAAYAPTDTGAPSYFEQRYDRITDTSHLALYPGPTTSTSLSIIQAKGLSELGSDSANLDMPDAALDAILERALRAYRAWDGGTTPTQLSATENAVIDTSDQFKNTSNAKQGYVRH